MENTEQPRVLVVTVGLSPVPVALSVLTLQPTHVVFVESEESKTETDRVIEVVQKVSERHGRAAFTPLRFTVSTDATGSFTVLAGLLGIPRQNLQQPDGTTLWGLFESQFGRECGFLLDYTGGTKVMVSCLVEFLIAWHGSDRPEQRSYVPGGAEQLLFSGPHHGDGGAVNRFLPLFPHLSVADRAALNGYQLVDGYRWTPGPSQILGPEVPFSWPDPAQDNAEAACAAWQDGFNTFTAGFQPFGENAGAVVLGTQAECILAGMMGVHIPDELLLGVKMRPEAETDSRAEFDVVWRLGNTIIVGEAKNNLLPRSIKSIFTSLATRVLLSREIIGATVNNLLWAAGSPRDSLIHFRALSSVLGEPGRFGHGQVAVPDPARFRKTEPGTLVASQRDVVDFIDRLQRQAAQVQIAADWNPWQRVVPPLSAAISQREVVGFSDTDGRVVAIGGLGGSPLGARVSQLIDEIETLVLGTKDTASRFNTFIQADKPWLRETTDEPSVRKQLEERAVRLGARGFIVTAGTKSLTAAMTALAVQEGWDLGSIDITADRVVTRSGQVFTLTADEVDWDAFLNLSGCALGPPVSGCMAQALSAMPGGPWRDLVLRTDLRDAAGVFPDAIQTGPHRVRVAHRSYGPDKGQRRRLQARLAVTSRLFGDAADIVLIGGKEGDSISREADQFPLSTLPVSVRERIWMLTVDGVVVREGKTL